VSVFLFVQSLHSHQGITCSKWKSNRRGTLGCCCLLTSKSNAAANAAAFRIIRKEGPRKKGEISIAGGNGKYFILDFYQSFPLMV
jgi:hypothetical protein